jgi:tight adherence protein B
VSQTLLTFIIIIALVVSGVGIILIGLFYILLSPTPVQERMSLFVEAPAEGHRPALAEKRGLFSGFRSFLNNALTILTSRELQLKISSVDWPITATEFSLMRLGVVILGFLIGWLLSGHIIGGGAVGVVGYMIPGFILNRTMDQRQKTFQNQLIDVLVLIRGAVQAGYSLLQSLDVVVTELPPPASKEFARVQREVQLGLPLSQALQNLVARMESDDLHMIVTAIIINSQVGGNLRTILTAVTETIRNRMYLFGEVRALTSYARYVSYLLSLLPFITAAIIFLINPTYFDTAFTAGFTQVLLLLALVGILIGNFWLRRIAQIKV